jgi:negative regulator of flagellin synthesis FlgM
MKISDDLPTLDKRSVSSKTADQGKVVPLKDSNDRHDQRGEERVSLSQKARDINKIREIVEKTPDVRADKVALLRKKIADGDYAVKGKDIADKMLREFLLEDLLKKEH